jgi:hypothetical protein
MLVSKIKEHKLILVLFFLFLVTLTIFIGFYFNIFTKNTELSYQVCAPSDYDCVNEVALANAQNITLNESLQKLYEFYKASDADPIHCHHSLHLVGSSFYNTFKEKAFEGIANVCSGAYYHGILFGGIENIDRSAPTELLADRLNDICDRSSKDLGGLSRTCVHGVGHAAYLFYEKLEPSIDVCLVANYDENYLDSCLAGAFMEPVFSPKNNENFRDTPFSYCDTYRKYEERMVLKNCLFYSLSHKILDGKSNLDNFCSAGVLSDRTYCENVYGTTLGYSLADVTDPRIKDLDINVLKQECFASLPCKEYYDNSFNFLTGLDSGSDPTEGAWK